MNLADALFDGPGEVAAIEEAARRNRFPEKLLHAVAASLGVEEFEDDNGKRYWRLPEKVVPLWRYPADDDARSAA